MFQEDLTVFTQGEFSTVAEVTSATVLTERTSHAPGATPGGVSSLSGIFDESYQSFDSYGSAQSSEGRSFCFLTQTQLITDLQIGDRLKIKGKSYQIISFEPKHDGALTDIILKQGAR